MSEWNKENHKTQEAKRVGPNGISAKYVYIYLAYEPKLLHTLR